MKAHILAAALAAGASLIASTPADAGLFRAYLSKSGSDTNDCSLALPCRLLPAALAAANSGGEIWILDSANYNVGPVTLDKPITILAVPGVMGSVVGNGGDAIIVNAPAGRIALRNLAILNISGGSYGLRVDAASDVLVEASEVHGFPTAGISLTTSTRLVVDDSTIRQNGNGIMLDNGARASVNRSRLVNNSTAGLQAIATTGGTTTSAVLRDSVMNGNTGYGVLAQGSAGNTRVTLKNCEASHNGLDGAQLSGNGNPAGTTRIIASGVTATRNGRYGFSTFGTNVTFLSDGTNVLDDNPTADRNLPLTAATTY